MTSSPSTPPASSPIAHLFRSQVYQIAEYLGVPDEIRNRQLETDACRTNGVPAAAVAETLGLPAERVERVFRDFGSRRRVMHSLYAGPQLLGDFAAVES